MAAELEDLLPSIWLSLSIKSSVRFRSVSKSWCASLSDPHFIYKNLTADNEQDLLLLADLECQHYNSIVSQETLTSAPLQVSPPKVHVSSEFGCGRLSPPCDDMVCFHVLEGITYVRSMGVWNLTTGETKMVPLLVIDEYVPSNGAAFPFFVTLGFGFDEKGKEYKIVQIVWLDSGEFAGYVYSLSSSSSNGWRKVGEPKMLYNELPYSRSYKDGTFYWGLWDQIVSFDMSSEVFNPISVSLPDQMSSRPRQITDICRLKEGSMSMITVNQYRKGKKGSWHSEYEIWALLDVGVKQSLTKLAVIDCGCEDEYEPFGFWRNELILRPKGNSRLVISDPFEREIRKIHIDEPYDILRCLAWTKKGRRTVC